jgi:hypothetical protein
MVVYLLDLSAKTAGEVDALYKNGAFLTQEDGAEYDASPARRSHAIFRY